MIIKNTFYNLIGLGAPLIVAIFSIPMLIDALGADRFGLLTLIWAVVSYFGLFDLGLGKAVTQQLALVFEKQQHDLIGPLLATATLLMGGLGVVAGILMAISASWGVGLVNGIPDKQEAVNAVYFMALAMPAIVLTSCFRGILEARHAFGVVNFIRLPMGIFTFIGPLAVVIYGEPKLDWITCVLALGRLVACIVHAYYAWRELPLDRGPFDVRIDLLAPLYVSGGWITISNIVSPFMGYVDRFIIGGIVSVSAVAFYSTPQEIATKLWIIPGALTPVLFPTFAIKVAQGGDAAWILLKDSVYWLFVVLLPIIVAIMLFSHTLLSIWISPNFADHSAVLLQIFSGGILINSLAHVPFTLIQSSGKSKLTALIHVIELPFFLIALWLLTSKYGVTGAAIAWLMRIIIDTSLMFVFCSSMLGKSPKALLNKKLLLMLILAAGAFSGAMFNSMTTRVLWVFLTVIVLFLSAFRRRSHH